jgi:uncharacterized protein (TIGR02145 family)
MIRSSIKIAQPYEIIINPTTNKKWLDRNLGASRVALSSNDDFAYGDLYQWGRLTDGHEKRTSGTTSTLSNSNNPGHGNFILAPLDPYDWRSPQNSSLWQGAGGINNPCPDGFRVPTEAEWIEEVASWSTSDPTGAFGSHLKLTVGGHRYYYFGTLQWGGYLGSYWSSSNGKYGRCLEFLPGYAGIGGKNKAYGSSVRCIKDTTPDR